MKIDNKKLPLTQTNQSQSQAMVAQMGDADIVVDLLRKHYANPRQTVFQEYLSNARDAHRECSQLRAIEVTLPTKKQAILKIRDFGNKMTKERLENNFLNYGSSTKRDSNLQTGGFGIGSKSAWVYTHTFFIRVIQEGVETLYEASTAKHYRGALTPIFSKPSKEDSGVEIQIPVQLGDIEYFHKAFYRATYFWQEQVKVVNLTSDEIESEWVEKNYITKDNYYFFNINDSVIQFLQKIDVSFASRQSNGSVIIDGIPYPIPKTATIDLPRSVALPRFKTGDLSISISREAIEENEGNFQSFKTKIKSSNFKQELNEAIAKLVEEITPKNKLNFTELVKYFSDVYTKPNAPVLIFQLENNLLFDIISGKFINNKSGYRALHVVDKNRIEFVYNLPALNLSGFYKTMRSSYSLDKLGGKIDHARKLKIFLNDGRDSSSMIESLIKYQTSNPVFEKSDYVLVVNNPGDERIKEFLQTIQALPLSPVLDEFKKSSNQIKNTFNPGFKRGVDVTSQVVRTADNCLKKTFSSTWNNTLRNVVNSTSLLTQEVEYVVASWEDKKAVEELTHLNFLIDHESSVKLLFVTTKDLSFFTDKKYFKIENYRKAKFYKKIISHLSTEYTFMQHAPKGKETLVYSLIRKLKLCALRPNSAISGGWHNQSVRRALKYHCRKYNIKESIKIRTLISKVSKNPSFKYLSSYARSNALKKNDVSHFKKILKV